MNYSQEILSSQFLIDHLFNTETNNLTGKKLEALLIKKQCEQLLSQIEQSVNCTKDVLELQILIENKVLVDNQIMLLEKFLACLRENNQIQNTVKTETLKAESQILKTKIINYEKK